MSFTLCFFAEVSVCHPYVFHGITSLCNNYIHLQKFPGDLLPATFPDPDNLEAVKGRTEVERRKEYIDLLTSNSAHQLGIVQLVKKCLHNTPERRHTSTELLDKLQEIKRVEDHSPPNLHDIANDDTVKEKPKPTQDHVSV